MFLELVPLLGPEIGLECGLMMRELDGLAGAVHSLSRVVEDDGSGPVGNSDLHAHFVQPGGDLGLR